MRDVFITRAANFLPNEAIENEEMEAYLGMIHGEKSRSKAIVLRNNKIKQRYYALDKEGKPTHTNAQMASLAIRKLFEANPDELTTVDLLASGTSSADQLMPSHAVTTHGWIPELGNLEVVSLSGVCCAGMHAFKYAFLSVASGEKEKAVASASERFTPLLRNTQFEDEVQKLAELNENPYIAFEKDFLRWMLSDGAGAFLMEPTPAPSGISLKVEWIECASYAHVEEPCMYMGCEKLEDGSLHSFKDYTYDEIAERSAMSIRQDVKLLSRQIVALGYHKLEEIMEKRNLTVDQVDHFLPHLSSYFFEDKIYEILENHGNTIPKGKVVHEFGNQRECRCRLDLSHD